MIEPEATTRQRILRAATELLAAGGREAVSTRTVSAAAGVQPPTIYRQFGDMRGLLDAVVEQGFSTYLQRKEHQRPGDDPVDDLRQGWDLHIGFGLENPAIYMLMYGEPRQRPIPPTFAAGIAILHRLVARVAEAGRLGVLPGHAVRMIHAAGVGVTLTLLEQPADQRDPLLADMTREAILAAITTGDDGGDRAEAPRPAAARHAIALRAIIATNPGDLSDGEQVLLAEWLDRIAVTV